jgi:uncharacterized protein
VRRRTALITGASAGIGEAFADVFAAEGFDLVLVARREDRLRTVGARVAQRYGIAVHFVVSDLSRPDAVQQICSELAADNIVVDALVNNAGYGVPGVFMASSWERHDAMLHVMLLAVLELTHRLLPGMIERRYGRVINVASVAGLAPGTAGHTLYGATKAFLIKFSESLAAESLRHGVHVTALCPGFTYSEFHDVNGMRTQVSQMPGWMWMDAPTVARQGYDAVMSATPVHITGRVNRSIVTLVRMLPQRLVNALARRTGRRYRNTDEGRAADA